MRILIALTMLVGACAPNGERASCLDDESVIALDAGWERAYLERDVAFLETLLADDYTWVHTHATVIDTRQDVLDRVSAGGEWTMVSREQSDVEVRRLGSTAVVGGYTVVRHADRATRYRFMRAYVEVDGTCLLLANQTMAIPEDEPS